MVGRDRSLLPDEDTEVTVGCELDGHDAVHSDGPTDVPVLAWDPRLSPVGRKGTPGRSDQRVVDAGGWGLCSRQDPLLRPHPDPRDRGLFLDIVNDGSTPDKPPLSPSLKSPVRGYNPPPLRSPLRRDPYPVDGRLVGTCHPVLAPRRRGSTPVTEGPRGRRVRLARAEDGLGVGEADTDVGPPVAPITTPGPPEPGRRLHDRTPRSPSNHGKDLFLQDLSENPISLPLLKLHPLSPPTLLSGSY